MTARIGVLTSGGDSPGMNACIRAVIRAGLVHGYEMFAIYQGFKGLVENQIEQVDRRFASEIINRGGTVLRTARLPSFLQEDVQKIAVANLKQHRIDTLVIIGGDGSYRGASALSRLGVRCVCLPGTIDNDVSSTDYTIGFDTALNTIVECIDKLRDTSSSHQRCSIIEVMGRRCGDLALFSGIASGVELIVSSERPLNEEEILAQLEEGKQSGKRHFIIVVSEKLWDVFALAKTIESKIGIEARATVIGHLQRGGIPSASDRVLAARMGAGAIEALTRGNDSFAVGILQNHISFIPLEEALSMPRMVDLRLYTDAEQLK